MQLLTYSLPDDHNWFLFGDQHKGSIFSSRSAWEQFIDAVHSKYDGCKNNYASDGGDLTESIMVDDPRFSEDTLKQPLPLEQMDECIKDRRPIAKNLLAVLQGNHDDKLWKFGNTVERVARELGVPYGTYACKFTITDKKGDLMYKLFQTHGHRSISSTADDPKRRRVNMQLILKRHLKHKAGDCAIMIKHHVHRVLICRPDRELYLTDEQGDIKQHYTTYGQTENYIHPDAKWYGCAGSFMRLYREGISGYAEKAEYDPMELGFLVLVVRDRKIVSLNPYYLGV